MLVSHQYHHPYLVPWLSPLDLELDCPPEHKSELRQPDRLSRVRSRVEHLHRSLMRVQSPLLALWKRAYPLELAQWERRLVLWLLRKSARRGRKLCLVPVGPFPLLLEHALFRDGLRGRVCGSTRRRREELNQYVSEKTVSLPRDGRKGSSG